MIHGIFVFAVKEVPCFNDFCELAKHCHLSFPSQTYNQQDWTPTLADLSNGKNLNVQGSKDSAIENAKQLACSKSLGQEVVDEQIFEPF